MSGPNGNKKLLILLRVETQYFASPALNFIYEKVLLLSNVCAYHICHAVCFYRFFPGGNYHQQQVRLVKAGDDGTLYGICA